ncbi:MAG: TonB-dependent receptor [Gammaproteobacteria bacterium]|nr:TonB-dependent receptor [Gammaproteobacteria bacterium]MYF59050.1 TonB-dependent receptor [Gammaproteobacteria bacterium]
MIRQAQSFDHARFRKHAGTLALTSLAGLWALAAVPAATAQEDAQASGAAGALEEIVVTARKREENLQDVPLTIDVISGDLMRSGGIETIDDIEYAVPGLAVGNRGFNGAYLGLRGISSIRSFVGDEAAVAVHLDGVFLPQSPQAFGNLFDIERIEVLKGPQGTEYGRNATAGVINVVTANPDTEASSGDVNASFGSHGAVRMNGMANIVTGERSALRIAVSVAESDGYIRNVIDGSDVGGEDYSAGRISYQFETSESTRLLFKYQHSRNERPQVKIPRVPPNGNATQNGLNALARAGVSDFHDTIINVPIDSDRTDDNFSLQIDWDMGGFGVRSITGYTSFDNEVTLDFTLEPATSGDASTDGQSPNSNEGTSMSQELQVFALDPGRMDWRLGLYWIDTEAEETRFVSSGGLFYVPDTVLPFSAYYDDFLLDQEGSAYSAFGELSFALSDDLGVTFGLRYTDEDKTQTQTETAGGDIPTACGGTPIGFAWCGEARLYTATASRSWSDTSGRISVQWTPSDDLLAYASYSTGFRSGAIGGVIGFDNFAVDGGWNYNGSGVYRGPNGTLGLQPFEPETVDNIDIGVKSTLMDGRLQINASWFFARFEDQLVFQVDPDQQFRLIEGNIGESEATGVDFQVNWAVSEALLVSLGGQVLDTEIVDLGNFDVSGGTEEGIALPRAPELSYAASVQYTAPVGNSGELTVRGEYNYKDDVFMDLSERRPQDAVGLFNVILRYDSGGSWYAFLNGRNLSDEEYLLDNEARVDAGGGAALQNASPGAPRTYEVGVGIRF